MLNEAANSTSSSLSINVVRTVEADDIVLAVVVSVAAVVAADEAVLGAVVVAAAPAGPRVIAKGAFLEDDSLAVRYRGLFGPEAEVKCLIRLGLIGDECDRPVNDIGCCTSPNAG